MSTPLPHIHTHTHTPPDPIHTPSRQDRSLKEAQLQHKDEVATAKAEVWTKVEEEAQQKLEVQDRLLEQERGSEQSVKLGVETGRAEIEKRLKQQFQAKFEAMAAKTKAEKERSILEVEQRAKRALDMLMAKTEQLDEQLVDMGVHNLGRIFLRFIALNLRMAWKNWVEHTNRARHWHVVTRHHHDLLEKFMHRIKYGRLQLYYSRWADRSANSRARRHITRKVINRLLKVNLLRAFNCWTDVLATWQRRAALLLRVLGRITHARESAGIRKWRGVILDEKRAAGHAALVRKYAKRILDRGLAKTFNGWVAWVKGTKRLRHAADRVVRRWTHRTAVACYNRWCEFIRRRRLCRRVIVRFVRRYRQQSLTQALNSWRYFLMVTAFSTAESTRQQLVVERCALRLRSALKSRAFGAWSEAAKSLVERRWQVRRAVDRWQRRNLAAFLDKWIDMVDVRVLCRHVMNKILQRYLLSGLSRAYISWRAFVDDDKKAMAEEARLEVIVRKVGRRMASLVVARTFDRWVEVAEVKRTYRRKMAKVLRRWQRLELVAMLEKWIAMTDERILCRRVMNKILQRYLLAGQSRAFISWRAFVDDDKLRMVDDDRLNAVVRRVAKRMVQLSVARTFDRWYEHSTERREQRRKVGAVLKRWQQLELSAMLDKWAVMTDERILCRRVLNKIMQRYLLSAQSRAMISWRAFVDDDKKTELEDVRLAVIVRKIAVRMVRLTVAKTFDRWAFNVAEKRDQRRKMGSVLRRWQRLEMSSMLEKWIVMTDERILCRMVMNKIIKRYLLGAQSRAVISWRAFADDDKKADAEDTRLEVIVRKIGKRMIQLSVARTFDRWFEHSKERREQRRKVGSVLRRWQRLEMSAMLEKWIVMTDERILCRMVMNKIIKRYLLGAQSRAFISWRAFMTDDKNADMEDARMEVIVRKIAKRWVKLTEAHSFERWVENVVEAKEWRHKVSVVLRRWQRRAIGAVVNRWCTMVGERVLCRRVMTKILRRYMCAAQARALVSWRAFVDDDKKADVEEARLEVVVRKVVKRMIQLTVARSFDMWSVNVVEAKEQRHKVATVLRRWQRRALGAVVNRWCTMSTSGCCVAW